MTIDVTDSHVGRQLGEFDTNSKKLDTKGKQDNPHATWVVCCAIGG